MNDLEARVKFAQARKLPPRKYPTPEEVAAENREIAIDTRKRVWQVRFLNVIANKLHAWGDSVKTLANRIDMPTLPKQEKENTELDKIVK